MIGRSCLLLVFSLIIVVFSNLTTPQSLLNYEQVLIDRPVVGELSKVTFRYLSLDEYDVPKGSAIGIELPSYYRQQSTDSNHPVKCSYSVSDANPRFATQCDKTHYLIEGDLPSVVVCETSTNIHISRATVLRVFCNNIPLPPEGPHTQNPSSFNHEGKITIIAPQQKTLFTHRLEFPNLSVIPDGDPKEAHDRTFAILYISGKRDKPFSIHEIERIRNELVNIFRDGSEFTHYQSLLLPDPITEEDDGELVTTAFMVTSESFDPDEVGFVALAFQEEILSAVKRIAPDLDKVITGGYIVPIAGSCFNGKRDYFETDKDCSRSCSLCPIGALCNNDLDCEYGHCRYIEKVKQEFEKRYIDTVPVEGRHRPFSGRSKISDDLKSYFPQGRCKVNQAFALYTGLSMVTLTFVTLLLLFI